MNACAYRHTHTQALTALQLWAGQPEESQGLSCGLTQRAHKHTYTHTRVRAHASTGSQWSCTFFSPLLLHMVSSCSGFVLQLCTDDTPIQRVQNLGRLQFAASFPQITAATMARKSFLAPCLSTPNLPKMGHECDSRCAGASYVFVFIGLLCFTDAF